MTEKRLKLAPILWFVAFALVMFSCAHIVGLYKTYSGEWAILKKVDRAVIYKQENLCQVVLLEGVDPGSVGCIASYYDDRFIVQCDRYRGQLPMRGISKVAVPCNIYLGEKNPEFLQTRTGKVRIEYLEASEVSGSLPPLGKDASKG